MVGTRKFEITKQDPRIVVFSKEEISSLLKAANDRTRLYLLLMLNCGMTQKDIADLHVSEVDWKAGRIIRKRSKTKDCKSVPTVDYLLWPETFNLLRQERNLQSIDRVLTNRGGSPLWVEHQNADGKYQKTDNIKNAFERLCRAEKITGKSIKSLKKAAATLLADHESFAGLESLLIGHAPQRMSERHYAKAPRQLFDKAVSWLRDEFGIAEAVASAGSKQSSEPGTAKSNT